MPLRLPVGNDCPPEKLVLVHKGDRSLFGSLFAGGNILNLHYYRARIYDPAVGRFLQENPVFGFASVPQFLNRYPYVTNNPVRFVDPLGLINFLAGAGFSAIAPGGAEASAGIVLNPGKGVDIGFFGSVGTGGGVNISADILFLGFVTGDIANVEGLTANINIVVGPISVTVFADPETGELVGGTVGAGPEIPLPVQASGSVSTTGTLTVNLGDILDFVVDSIFGKAVRCK